MNRKQRQEATKARNAEQERRKAKCVFGAKHQTTITRVAKRPLMAIAKVINKVLPEPTVDNTWHPNSHRMIQIRDEFKKNCTLSADRVNLIVTGMNFAIMMYDFDRPYRDMMDWAKDRLDELGWTPRGSLDLIGADWPWWNEDHEDEE